MRSLAEQVRAAVITPRGRARLAGLPIPQFEGKDRTFEDLKARVAWALGFLDGLEPVANSAMLWCAPADHVPGRRGGAAP